MGFLIDGLVLQKYRCEWEVMHLYFDIPPNTRIELEYTVPRNRVFIELYETVGTLNYGTVKFSLVYDGTFRVADVCVSESVNRMWYVYPFRFAYNNIKITLENVTDEMQEIDFYASGVLVPPEDAKRIIDDFSRNNRDILSEIRDQNKKICEKLDELIDTMKKSIRL